MFRVAGIKSGIVLASVLASFLIFKVAYSASPGVMNYYLKNIEYPLPLDPNKDSDGDGVLNKDDAFPHNHLEWKDTDHDGIGDNSDPDIDGDGIPNTYEVANGLNPYVNDANLDADHDGVSNYQEYLSGTKANDPTSCSGSSCVIAAAPAPATISFPAQDTVSDQVAATAGTFNVSNSGAAEYTIPLYTPPGTAGVAPKLALQYRSNGGYGMLGQGWSLGALSAITRCPKTKVQDNVIGSVSYNGDDRFCLDGERLVLKTPSGTYGAPGAEYRTESDSYKKIVSYGGDSDSGPDYFKVWNKDGSVSEYGNTADSKLVNGVNYVWAQNKIEDATSYGTSTKNPVSYSYQHDTSERELRIANIYYAGGNGSPNSQVSFLYETRPDVRSGQAAPANYNSIYRLNKVQVFNMIGSGQFNLVRQYNLAYLDNSARKNQTSKLASVTECVNTVCLPPTQFTWSDSNVDYQLTPSSNVSGFATYPFTGATINRFIPADFDSDGRSDLVWLEPDGNQYRFKVSLSDGTTLVGTSIQTTNSQTIESWTVTDYNQDGYPDVLYSAQGALYVYFNVANNGQRAFAATPVQLIANMDTGAEPSLDGSWSTPKAIFADINSDGVIDVMYNKAIYLAVKDPAATYGPYKFGTPTAITLGLPSTAWSLNFYAKMYGFGSMAYNDSYKTIDLNSAQFSGDFNGDGLPDIIANVIYQIGSNTPFIGGKVILASNGSGGYSYSKAFSLAPAGTPAAPSYSYHSLDARQILTADINGDGLSDVLWQESTANWAWQGYLGRGSFGPIGPFSITSPMFDDVSLVDVNQDGLPDFIHRNVIANADDQLLVMLNGGGVVGGLSVPYGSDQQIATITDTNPGNFVFLDLNGDGILDMVDLASKAWLGTTANGTAYNKITKITNGLGEEINITYKPLTDSSVYVREFNAPTLNQGAPVFDVFGPMYVVSAVNHSSPTAGNANYQHATSYQYQGLKTQPAGRGALGFHVRRVADGETGTVESTTFRQDYPFIGLVADSEVYPSGQTTALKEVVNSYAMLPNINGVTTAPPYVIGLTQSVTTQRVAENTAGGGTTPLVVANGVLTVTTDTHSNFDAYGNVGTEVVSITGDGSSLTTTTNNTYSNNATSWLIQKLTHSVVTRQLGSSTITRTTDFTYDSYGRLATKVREPQGDATVKLTTTYAYDTFGNPNQITDSSAAGTRYTRTVYDASGRFVDQTYNGLEQLVSQVTARDMYGNPTTVVGLNGVQKYYRYGTFGRQYFVASNNGSSATTLYRLCSAVSCPAGAAYRVQTAGVDGSLVNTYADKLGRAIRTETKAFSGNYSLVDTQYDGSGRVSATSVPYFSGDAEYWASSSYDNLGRVIKVVDAQGGISTNQYSRYSSGSVVGVQQLSKNQLNQSKTTIVNGRGQNLSVIDNLGGTINYSYDADGNLVQLVSNGVTSSIGYDLLDRKIALNDPDQGTWQYIYNAFGEMTYQQDSNQSLSSMTFDTLGRMVGRQDRRPDLTLESDTVWTYGTDSSKGNAGQLVTVLDNITDYLQTYNYDTLGRPSRTGTSLGLNGADGNYFEFVTYDQYGRVFQQIDPTYKGVQLSYNANGYQDKIVEATNVSHVYRAVAATNARGQVTAEGLYDGQFQLAHGFNAQTGLASSINAQSNYSIPRTLLDISLNFDAVGNLSSRTRNVQAQGSLGAKTLSESFTYDQLNRLTSVTPSGASTQSISYDLAGNITSKSDVGAYSYDPSRPHAVSSAGGSSYTYDSIGNMLSGGGRTAVYNSFRKPVSITRGSNTTTFQYGPDRSHYKRVDNNGVNITTTWYVGNLEIVQVDNGPLKTKRYIGGTLVVTDYNGTHDEQAMLTDHLGSTVAMAKANTLELYQEDYDAFGKRRDMWTVSELASADKITLDRITTHGFTGHEMLDEVGLIHMKGRVYDPNLGRFLSADPNITQLDNSQNLNRYSYVYNNPLTLTDPTGFDVSGSSTSNADQAAADAAQAAAIAYANEMANFQSYLIGLAVFGSYSYQPVQVDPLTIITQNLQIAIQNNQPTEPSKAPDCNCEVVTVVAQRPNGSTTTIDFGVLNPVVNTGTTSTPDTSALLGTQAGTIGTNNTTSDTKNVQGENFTKNHEVPGGKPILDVHDDGTGKATIGFGHKLTEDEIKNNTYEDGITTDQAEKLFEKDYQNAVQAVNNMVKVNLSSGQEAALVDLVYNVGAAKVSGYNLIIDINNGDFASAANDFLDITKATLSSGEVVRPKGLVTRRKDESNLFINGF